MPVKIPEAWLVRPAADVQFKAGDKVRVRSAAPLGHVRTPWYVRGHSGVIERFCGCFANPEEIAYVRAGLPAQPLYRVRFLQCELWPDYGGAPRDCLDVDLYQHWLDKIEER